MKRLKIANLLDDFALGGVSVGLKVFDHPRIAEQIESRTIAVNPEALIAPKLDADIIIVHYPPRWRGLVFLLSLRLRNPKATIIHLEHSYSREFAALHIGHHARFRSLLKIAFTLSHEIIAVSHAQADWLVKLGAVSPSKIRVIYPYGHDQNLAHVPDMRLPKSQALTVGCYGRFHESKGFERIITAFQQLDKTDKMQLLIGGFGEDEALLKALAQGCDNIRFVGKVTDRAAFLQQCHVLAVPSRYECFGQVATEAREAGRPILVSTAGGLPEQVGDAGIIVNCDDTDILVRELKSLRTKPLEIMGAIGRRDAASCIESRIDNWLSLFDQIAFLKRASHQHQSGPANISEHFKIFAKTIQRVNQRH